MTISRQDGAVSTTTHLHGLHCTCGHATKKTPEILPYLLPAHSVLYATEGLMHNMMSQVFINMMLLYVGCRQLAKHAGTAECSTTAAGWVGTTAD